MKMLSHTVTGYGGVRLHVREAGKPGGAADPLLIHGWSQHHLSWSKQFRGALAERFRLIALDLRGHGASDKPLEAHQYNCPSPWADDVQAIIRGLDLDRPLLVGWSLGGWIVMDYLSIHGDEAISGAALVGASVTGPSDPTAKRLAAVDATGAYSADQGVALTSIIGFLRACFAAPLSKQDLALMTGFNMLVPPEVRKAARTRADEPDASVLMASQKPVGLFWG